MIPEDMVLFWEQQQRMFQTKSSKGYRCHPSLWLHQMEWSDHTDKKYQTVKTGEGYLRVGISKVVGVGGHETGLGLYTLKNIPTDTYVCCIHPLPI
ncbi:hypothetical protein ACROYT_G015211 [Oculina patagonica]